MQDRKEWGSMTVERICEIADRLGWLASAENTNSSHEFEVEFEQGSPAGEDFCFCAYGDASAIVVAVRDYANSFDEEEHIRTLLNAKENGFAGVLDVKTLVQDAQAIHKMLNTLTDALESRLHIVSDGGAAGDK